MMSTLKSWCMAREHLDRLRAWHHLLHEPDVPGGQLAHARLDALQVVVDEVAAVGKPEVVEEAVLDRGTDVVLGTGKQTRSLRRPSGGRRCAAGSRASARTAPGVGRLLPRRRRRSRQACDADSTQSARRRSVSLRVVRSAGEAGHARGDILARAAQLVQLRLGIECRSAGNRSAADATSVSGRADARRAWLRRRS